MNTLPLILLLLGKGILMAFVAFGSIYGIASMLETENPMDPRVLFAFFIISIIVLYGVSFGAFAGVQKDSCGDVKSWKQVAINASIPLGSFVILISLVMMISWFRNVVGDMFPPDSPETLKLASTLAFYSFWATLMGGALGGTLSGSCKTETPAIFDIKRPTIPTNPKELNEYNDFGESQLPTMSNTSFRFQSNMPPE